MKRKRIGCIAVIVAFLAPLTVFAATATKPTKPAATKKEVPCLSARGRSPYKIESICMRVEHDGVTRTYRLYKPRTPAASKTATAKPAGSKPVAATAAPTGPLPILLVLHGGDGSGSTIEQMTLGQFNRIADKNRVIIAYPDGIDRGWNDGRSDLKASPAKESVDDVGFLRAVVDDIAKRQPASQPVNRARIYAVGISNGGLLSYRLACDAADLVAAVAAVAANLSKDLSRECRPSRTVPIATINGTDDPIMPWLGGNVEVLLSRRGEVLSAQETFEFWAKLGDCALPNTHMQFRDKSAKGTTVIRHVARDCADGGETRLYEIVGGGHTWPYGYQYLSERVVGKTSRDLNASNEIWSFLARYSL